MFDLQKMLNYGVSKNLNLAMKLGLDWNLIPTHYRHYLHIFIKAHQGKHMNRNKSGYQNQVTLWELKIL